jgi:hypothetical protein
MTWSAAAVRNLKLFFAYRAARQLRSFFIGGGNSEIFPISAATAAYTSKNNHIDDRSNPYDRI